MVESKAFCWPLYQVQGTNCGLLSTNLVDLNHVVQVEGSKMFQFHSLGTTQMKTFLFFFSLRLHFAHQNLTAAIVHLITDHLSMIKASGLSLNKSSMYP